MGYGVCMIKSREDVIHWVLRALGHPVIQVNVTDEQLEDRLDDALELFHEYNLGGTNKEYLRYQIEEQDILNQYLPIDGSSVIGIVRLIPLPSLITGNKDPLFDPLYQLLNTTNQRGWVTLDLQTYFMFQQYAKTLELILRPRHNIRFNRYQDKIYVDWHWGDRDFNQYDITDEYGNKLLLESDVPGDNIEESYKFQNSANTDTSTDVRVGDFVILECFRVLDPNEYPAVYGDRWLKEYFKAKVKYQWGQNLSKYSNMTLPGGVSLDGNSMMVDAQTEIDKLQELLYSDYSEPLGFFIG